MSKHSVLIQWSEEDNAFIAIIPELKGLSAFGATPEKAAKELSIARKLYLDVLKEDGEEVPEPDTLKPFSGQTRLRLPKSLHASLSNEAKKEGTSFNTYVVQLLSERNSLRVVRKDIESLKSVIQARVMGSSLIKTQVKETLLWDGSESLSVQGNTTLMQ